MVGIEALPRTGKTNWACLRAQSRSIGGQGLLLSCLYRPGTGRCGLWAQFRGGCTPTVLEGSNFSEWKLHDRHVALRRD
jgi:hypothetical protein